MTDVGKVTGIGPALAAALAAAGFPTAESLAAASADRIAVVPGIGRQRATRLIAAAKALIGQGEAPATPPRPLPSRDAPVRKVKAARPAPAAIAAMAAPEVEMTTAEPPPSVKLSKPARKARKAARRAAKQANTAMALAEKLMARAARKAARAEALAAMPAPAKKSKKKKS